MKMHSMRIFLALLLSLSLFACVPPPSKKSVSLPVGTLSKQEVRNLFLDHTVESETISKGRISVSYYNPNGQIIQLQDGKKRVGHWRVKSNGRICLAMEDEKESCRIIVRKGNSYTKYVVKKDGNHKPVVKYNWFKGGNRLEF